jgi:hypothetical protein
MARVNRVATPRLAGAAEAARAAPALGPQGSDPTRRRGEAGGELLSRVFHKEKSSEDSVLMEVVYGKTVTPLASDKTRQLALVPPTALAFEHTAVMAPADILKSNDDVTDPGKPDPTLADDGTPTPAKDPRLMTRPLDGRLMEQRKSFGLTFGGVQEPLIEQKLAERVCEPQQPIGRHRSRHAVVWQREHRQQHRVALVREAQQVWLLSLCKRQLPCDPETLGEGALARVFVPLQQRDDGRPL